MMFALCRSWIASVGLVALLAAAVVNPAQAAEETPLPIAAAVDSSGLEAYGPAAAISPDGSFAAYSVATAHVHQLRLLSLKDFTVLALTELTDDASAPAWCKDGKSLAFFIRRAGQNHLWTWAADSGELKQVSQTPVADLPPWLRPQWTPDCRSIVIALAIPAAATAKPQSAPQPEAIQVFKAYRPNSPPQLPSQRPPISDGVAIVDVGSGEVRKLSSGLIEGYQLNPSGTRLAVLERLPRPNPDAFEIFNRLQVIELQSGESKSMSATVTAVYGKFTWSPDGRYLGWVQDYPPEIGTAYLASAAEGTVRPIKADPGMKFATRPYGGKPPLWDASSRRFFIVADGELWVGKADEPVAHLITSTGDWKIGELVAGVLPGSAASGDNYGSIVASVLNKKTLQEGFARIDLRSGELQVLIKSDGHLTDSVNRAAVLPDGKRVLYPAQAADQPGALWLSDLKFHAPRRVALLNPELKDRVFGTSRLLEWRNSRGDVLQGALLLPAGYRSGRRYPMIVDIYAEPGAGRRKGLFGITEDGSGQIYATRGYVVFAPDTHLRLGTPVADLVDDVLSGLDAVLRTGIVDQKRMGVAGESYGGYNVVALISHSDRFHAAVSKAGFADLITAIYGNEGKGTLSSGWAEGDQQGRMGGSPWEYPRRYLDNSPLWQLDAVRTPLLLIHGAKDDTVPPFASVMIFNSLARLHRQVEFALYPDEGHGFLRRSNRIDEFARRLAWFDEHLDLARDDSARLLFDGNEPRSRNGTPPRSLEDLR